MEGGLGWQHGAGVVDGNNWDLNAVVRLGGGGPVVPADPFIAVPPPPQQNVAVNPWQEVMNVQAPLDLAIAAGFDDDFLPEVLLDAPYYVPEPEAQLLPRQEEPAPAAVKPPQRKPPSGGAGPSRSNRGRWLLRKNVTITKVTAAELAASDQWAWRKYGQKPIKDSPYERSYYKCSSDKACGVRKMVERHVDDPRALLTVAYESGNVHRHGAPPVRNNALLAGTTRRGQGTSRPPRKAPRANVCGRASRSREAAPLSAPAAVLDDEAVNVNLTIGSAVMDPEGRGTEGVAGSGGAAMVNDTLSVDDSEWDAAGAAWAATWRW